MSSQNTLNEGRVKTSEDKTKIIFSAEDGKAILEDLLKYEYSDSLLFQYAKINGLDIDVIRDQSTIISKLTTKYNNLEMEKQNLMTLVGNKEEEIEFMRTTFKQQEKVIKKHKRSKTLIIVGGVAAVVAMLLITK